MPPIIYNLIFLTFPRRLRLFFLLPARPPITHRHVLAPPSLRVITRRHASAVLIKVTAADIAVAINGREEHAPQAHDGRVDGDDGATCRRPPTTGGEDDELAQRAPPAYRPR